MKTGRETHKQTMLNAMTKVAWKMFAIPSAKQRKMHSTPVLAIESVGAIYSCWVQFVEVMRRITCWPSTTRRDSANPQLSRRGGRTFVATVALMQKNERQCEKLLTIDRRYLQAYHVSNSSIVSTRSHLTEIPRLEFFGERHLCDMADTGSGCGYLRVEYVVGCWIRGRSR